MLKGIITTFAVIAILYTYGACKYAYTEAHGGNHNSATIVVIAFPNGDGVQLDF
jgi:hypothetical protein